MSEPTPRELFNRIMHYEEVDRMPVFHWKGWAETYERWYKEGLPRDRQGELSYFNAADMSFGMDNNVSLYPAFEEEIIEETDDYRIFKGGDGVVCQDWKNQSCIPHYIDYTLKGEAEWPEYKKRLQPDPARIPANLDQKIADAQSSGLPIAVRTGSMIGWIRNWMGVTGMSYLAYDNRGLLGEMVNTIADLVVWTLEQILPKVKVDLGWGWEDICFRTGPLISPDIFQEVCVPGYRKISDTLLKYGCDLNLTDCDGWIDDLVPGWLEGGVNVMFPIEIGAWKADPAFFRKKYGKELLIFGGIDKLVIEKDKAAIDAEIESRIPLMKEGGFVPLPDHLITPDTSLDNYKYYLDKIRELRF